MLFLLCESEDVIFFLSCDVLFSGVNLDTSDNFLSHALFLHFVGGLETSNNFHIFSVISLVLFLDTCDHFLILRSISSLFMYYFSCVNLVSSNFFLILQCYVLLCGSGRISSFLVLHCFFS